MAQSGPPPPVQRPFLRLNRPVAIGVSVAAHAALLVAASRIEWATNEQVREPPPSVIWIREWPLAVAPPSEPAPVEEAVPPPLPPPPEEAPAEEAPAPAVSPAEEPRAPPPEEPPADAPPSEREAEPEQAPRLPRDIDWEAERRKAIEQMREQREREGEVYSFSFDEIPDAVPPEEDEPERPSVFDRPSGGSRSVLRPPGAARTKVGRAVSELCQALLGGGGMFGMSLCGEEEDVDFFPYIVPLNATGRPECQEVPGAVHPPSLRASPDEPVFKCRIVVDPDVLAEREATRPDNVALDAEPR